MGNNAMRRNNHGNERPPRHNPLISHSYGKRHAESLALSPRLVIPSHRIDTAPRAAQERAAPQSCSHGPSATGTRTPSSGPRRFKRSRPRDSKPWVSRMPNTTSARRRRTRPRSRPNTQSGDPVGGDLAVPGDQSTSPQPPQETHSQTVNSSETANVVRLDVCLPQTSSPPIPPAYSNLCISALVSACNSCQRIAPTRWKLLKKNVDKLKSSPFDHKACPPADAGSSNEPSPTEYSPDPLEGALVTGPRETPLADNDAVIPAMATGFYFGTSHRQSWPHTVASAEYFTVLSSRRIKKQEPPFYNDEMTTFKVNKDGREEQNRTTEGDEGDDNQAAKAAAAAAALAFGSSSGKRSSRKNQNIRRTRGSKSTTTSRTTKLRRAIGSKSSSANLRRTAMHDVFRRLLSVGQRRKEKCTNTKEDRNNGERARSTDIITPSSVKSRSSGKVTFSPRSCSFSARPSNQEKTPDEQILRHNPVEKDGKQSDSLRGGREIRRSLSYKNARSHYSTYRHRTSQREDAENIHKRKCSVASTEHSKANNTRSKNSQRSSIPRRAVCERKKSTRASTRNSMSPCDAQDSSTFDTICCSAEASVTTTLSGSRKSSVSVESRPTGMIRGSIRKEKNVGSKKGVRHKTFETNQKEDTCGRGACRCERGEQTSPTEICDLQNLISSKLGGCKPFSAQLFLNHVLHTPNPIPKEQTNAVRPADKCVNKSPDLDSKSAWSEADKCTPIETSKMYNPHVISGVAQKIYDGNFLMQYLVKSSVGVQNAVFPHLLAEERLSKTTQITPEDLVYSRGAESTATETLEEEIHFTHKYTELPLHKESMPSTSRKRLTKTTRHKNKLSIFRRARGAAQYKFVKRTTCPIHQNTPRSANNRTQSPPDKPNGKNRQEAYTNRPPTRFHARPHSVKKKTPKNIRRTASAPKSSTSLSKAQVKPHRAFRTKQMEGHSGSEVVSLFRANTKGSSVQSLEMDSSTLVFGLKATSFPKQGRTIKDVVLILEPRSPEKGPVKINNAGADTKQKCENAEITNMNKRRESTGRPWPKPPSERDSKRYSSAPLSESGHKEHNPRPPSEKAPYRNNPEISSNLAPSSLPLKSSNDTRSKPCSRKSLCDNASKSRTARPSSDSAKKPYSLKPQNDTESVSKSPRPTCGSKEQSSKTQRGSVVQKQSPQQCCASETKRGSPAPLGNSEPGFTRLTSDFGANGHSPTISSVFRPKTNIQRRKSGKNVSYERKQPVGMKQVSPPPASIYPYTKLTENVPRSQFCSESGTKPQLNVESPCTDSRHGSHHVSFEDFQSTKMLNESLHSLFNQHCFRSGSGRKSKYFEHADLLDKSVSNCSWNVHGRSSLSASSMVPAVGSYEDKVLTPNSLGEQCVYGKALPEDASFSSKRKLESQSNPGALQILEPYLDDSKGAPKSVKISSKSSDDIHSVSNERASSLCRFSILHQQEVVNDSKVSCKQVKAPPRDHKDSDIHKNVKGEMHIRQSAGVSSQSEAEGAPSTNSTTDLPQSELPGDFREHQQEDLCDRRRPITAALDRRLETVNLAGIPLPLKKEGSGQGYSAASTAVSILGRLSSQDSMESCGQTSTHSIGSNHKEASHNITSLTDAISSISSIPEDTLPNTANKNSTHHLLPDELCCDFSNGQPNVGDISPDAYNRRNYDNCWGSSSHHKSLKEKSPPFDISEPKQILNEKSCRIKMVQVSTLDNEPYKRYQRMPPVAMNIPWDTSMSTTFCAHSICSRCGAHRKEATDTCQPVGTCRYDQHQDDNFYVQKHNTRPRQSRCGRCTSCLRESYINHEQWSQLSSQDSHATRYHEYPDRSTNDDSTSGNFGLLKQNASPELQWSDFHSVILQTTPTHPFSSIGFQTPQENVSQARVFSGVQPSTTSGTLIVTPGTSSSDKGVQDIVNETVNCRDEPDLLAVASYCPIIIPTLDTSMDTLPVNAPGQRIKPHNTRLTLSPIYSTSLPEDVAARTPRSFNKDIVLQRIAGLLENNSSIPSIDSIKTIAEEVNKCTETENPEYHKRYLNQPLSEDASCEPRDSHLDRIIATIANRVNEFLRDMAVAVGELQKK